MLLSFIADTPTNGAGSFSTISFFVISSINAALAVSMLSS